MRKRLTAVILGGGAAALALALGTTTAMASNIDATWSVSPGGNISFSGTGQVKDASTGTVAKCTIKMTGTLKKGHGLSGAGLGTIKTASFTSCTIATVAVTVTTHGLPWKLNASSFNATGGVTTGNISGIDLVATAPGCSATLDGTGAGKNNGVTKISYSNSTGKLKLLPSGNLHSFAVSGCFGLVNNDDAQKASGTETISPKQTIHSP